MMMLCCGSDEKEGRAEEVGRRHLLIGCLELDILVSVLPHFQFQFLLLLTPTMARESVHSLTAGVPGRAK